MTMQWDDGDPPDTQPEPIIPRYRVILWLWVAAVVLYAIAELCGAAHGKTQWPTVAELQRCEVPFDKMKDAKLRRWCEYWSRRLP